MRAWLFAIATTACATSREPIRAVAHDDLAMDEATTTETPSRIVPLHYETKSIGPTAESAAMQWHGRAIDLDVKDADIGDVLRLLSDVGHANIVVDGDVTGRVTLRMRHVPWDQALYAIARTKGLAVETDGNVVLVRAHAAK